MSRCGRCGGLLVEEADVLTLVPEWVCLSGHRVTSTAVALTAYKPRRDTGDHFNPTPAQLFEITANWQAWPAWARRRANDK